MARGHTTWVGLACALGVAVLGSAPAEASFPGRNGGFAYDGPKGGENHSLGGDAIFSVDRDGGDRRMVTAIQHALPVPQWSPSGSSLLFDDVGGIYAIHPDGTHRRLVLADSAIPIPPDGDQADADFATWSPDARRITFSARWDKRDGTSRRAIYTASARGRHVRRLRRGGEPVWSPTGKLIAFLTLRNGVWLMHPDGHHARELLDVPEGSRRKVDFSPDGRRLVTYDSAYTRSDIQVVTLRTRHVRTLHMVGNVQDVSWAPNGRRIAYLLVRPQAPSDPVTPAEVRTVRPNGHGDRLRFQVPGLGAANTLSWQPLPR
jgi:Tol biopolymer transport system component